VQGNPILTAVILLESPSFFLGEGIRALAMLQRVQYVSSIILQMEGTTKSWKKK
jgi:hypothetical protein